MSDKKLSILVSSILLFTLLVLTASANSDYPNVGGKDYIFNNSKGIFRSTLSTSITGSDTVIVPKNMPLMADLDGDGINEIVVLDSSTFKIYKGGTFSGASASYSNSHIGSKPNFILYDINGDNNPEIISSSTNGTALILSYNGSSLNLNHIFYFTANSSLGYPFTGSSIVSCRAVDDCAIVYTSSQQNIPSPSRWTGVTKFDSNGNWLSNLTYHPHQESGGADCFPNNPLLQAINVIGDSSKEYVYASMATSPTGVLGSISIFILDGDTLEVLNEILITDVTFVAFNMLDCNYVSSGDDSIYPSSSFTNPMVVDIVDGGFPEIIIGFEISGNEYKMRSFRSTGALLRTYPTVFNAEGKMLSNIIMTNVFDNSQMKDFCILGYKGVKNELDLLCGSETTVFSFLGFPTLHDDEFIADLSDYGLKEITNFNIDSIYNANIHASFQGFSSDVIDIVTPFGIFSPDFSGINFLGLSSNSTLALNYIVPYENGTVVMLDADNVGKSDMVVLTLNNLWYINDNFVNSKAQIINISTNPCLTQVVQENSSVQVRVKIEDFDDDLVDGRAIFYVGDSNEQDSGWQGNFSSGTTFTFGFSANKTIGTGTLIIYARDTGQPLLNDSETILFTVSSVGLSFGSECNLFSEPLTSPFTTTTTTLAGSVNLGNNTFKNVFDNPFVQSFGLGYTVMWLLLMVIVGGGVWVYGSHANPLVSVGVVGLLEVFLFIVGAILGFISTGIIVTLVVMGLLVIGVWVASFFTKK